MTEVLDNKARVGIVTYIKSANYGSALQAFALQEYVTSLGYDACLIDWLDLTNRCNKKERFRHIASQLLWMAKAPRAFLRLHLNTGHSHTQNQMKRAVFSTFEDYYLRYSGGDFTRSDAFNAFICGSDQVWSLSTPGLHRTFFLRFAPQRKRISYAPSFGADTIPRYNRRVLSRYLNGMAHISVRELSGIQIVKEATGRDVPCVLDPVLLVGKEFWLKQIAQTEMAIDGPYMIAYFLSDNDAAVEYARQESSALSSHLIWIESGVQAPEGAKVVTPNPLEFVSLIAGATKVVTDSFHGLAFSLLFNKAFVIINRAYESNCAQSTRIQSILELAVGQGGTTDGLIGYQVEKGSRFDWQKVNASFEKEREKSRLYLVSALEDACGESGKHEV